ncbi:phospholysine phosphohistidine inorganic pyrophosphate phosphatase [Glomus cerebriforme]|uniref:Haloacid dehalogenase-like hydrolase domain-containing protein 2 n=1 Tax=Glomus cerebriforme TaxID=658196 RepID=A0A397SFI4_9GLOM|nr:phospholysine phosphohistidine inorganic pyrophosphate phosphatase [Glomus cerebriforme]
MIPVLVPFSQKLKLFIPMVTIRGVLIDLSGTLHVGDEACEGAVAGLKKLRQSGIPFRFCTNTTNQSVAKLEKKLTKLGFEGHKNEIFTSLLACRNIVLSRGLRPLLFLEDAALEDFHGIPTEEPNNAVVVGLSQTNFRYEMLNKAFRILINDQNTPFIAIHKAKYFAEPDGLSLGPGPFIESLEYASGVKPTVVGKPEKSFYELALQDMDLLNDANHVVMIGDDVANDLGSGAKELGLIRYLVKTGKYRTGDELREGGVDGLFENFGKAVDAIVDQLKK